MGIVLEPGFNWWVFLGLKKKDAMILLVKRCNVKYLILEDGTEVQSTSAKVGG